MAIINALLEVLWIYFTDYVSKEDLAVMLTVFKSKDTVKQF